MGCIPSRWSSEPGPSPIASVFLDANRLVETEASNSSLPLDTEGGGGGHLPARSGGRNIILNDIYVECSPDDDTHLHGLMLTIVGLEEETSGPLEEAAPTEWMWPGIVKLQRHMHKLIFIARSESRDLGTVCLTREDIVELLTAEDGSEHERQFSREESGPSTSMTFTINIFDIDNTLPLYTPEELDDIVDEVSKNPESFPAALEKVSKSPENDVNFALRALEQALEHTNAGDPSYALYIHAVGSALLNRFRVFGRFDDIESAIQSFNLSVSITFANDTTVPDRLSKLGIAYRLRFNHTGALTDIESAISNQQKGVQLTPDGHPELHSRLGSLGVSFKTRFQRQGDLADIESAIASTDKATKLIPDFHFDMPYWLGNLGSYYQIRFRRTQDLADSEIGISHHQKALKIARKEHPRRPSLLHDLGVSFRIRFEYTSELEDIANAIYNQQEAVSLTPDDRSVKPLLLRSLGISFHLRFKQTQQMVDIESSISNHRHAVLVTPEGHADMPFYLRSLANSLRSRFEHTKRTEDMLSSINFYRLAAIHISGPPHARLSAAREWALLSRQFDRPQSLQAFRVVIGLLSQVAGLEQTVHRRHANLVEVFDLTSSGVAAALDEGEIQTAVEWLEQGRCFVWNQINQLRTPIDSLRPYNASLADRFVRVAWALEQSGSRQEESISFSEETMTKLIATQEEVHTHIHLAKEWNDVLSEIRSITEFQDFLRPPKLSDLLVGVSSIGPLVTFNINLDRCDAFALLPGSDTPLHIPLESFSLQKAVQLRDDLQACLKGRGVRVREVDRSTLRIPWRKGQQVAVLNILSDLWNHVCSPVIKRLGYSSSPLVMNRPHLYWCTTGPLVFLPMHAAGLYGKDSPSGSCVSDFVVSSYTPTISLLIGKVNEVPMKNPVPTNLLLISQPNTRNMSSIPATRQETHTVRDAMTFANFSSLLLEDDAATVPRVKFEMKSHSWVHFACHAIQDAQDSLKSGIHLDDGRLELLEIMKLRMGNADHAFLSACQTGAGDEKLSDEVVHLAAGMLAAGYRGVVATMWAIKDRHGPEVAINFYTRLLEGHSSSTSSTTSMKRLASDGAANALDHAVKELRSKVGDKEDGLLTWVPYVHWGV